MRWKKVHVSWLQLGRELESYLDLDTLPKRFDVVDPSKLTKHMLGQLWDHWSKRARAKQPILKFTSAQTQDIGLPGSGHVQKSKQMAWQIRILESTDDKSNGQSKAANKDKHIGPSAGSPPSKCSHFGHDVQASNDESERPLPSKRPHL